MHFFKLFSVAALSVLATASAWSVLGASDVEDLAWDARDLDFDDELYLDAREESSPYEALIARTFEDDDFLDALFARTWSESSAHTAAVVGPGTVHHSGPDILKTSTYSVTSNTPNYSYPKGHPKNLESATEKAVV